MIWCFKWFKGCLGRSAECWFENSYNLWYLVEFGVCCLGFGLGVADCCALVEVVLWFWLGVFLG